MISDDKVYGTSRKLSTINKSRYLASGFMRTIQTPGDIFIDQYKLFRLKHVCIEVFMDIGKEKGNDLGLLTHYGCYAPRLTVPIRNVSSTTVYR